LCLISDLVVSTDVKTNAHVLKSFFVSGVLVLVVTLVGCCGISRESHSLVLTYSALLSIVFLAEVAAGVMAYLYRFEKKTRFFALEIDFRFNSEMILNVVVEVAM
jgi:hypothetical protein